MQWTRIKEHLIPTIMQEIDIVTTKYTSNLLIITIHRFNKSTKTAKNTRDPKFILYS